MSAQFDSQYNTYGELKGRLGFKQYTQNKPTEWGIKVFVLSDAITGYVKGFQIYTGTAAAVDEHNPGATSRVVLGLINGL